MLTAAALAWLLVTVLGWFRALLAQAAYRLRGSTITTHSAPHSGVLSPPCPSTPVRPCGRSERESDGHLARPRPGQVHAQIWHQRRRRS